MPMMAGGYIINFNPWRLTSEGHKFACTLVKPDILATIIEKFNKEGLSVVMYVVKQLAQKQADKLLG